MKAIILIPLTNRAALNSVRKVAVRPSKAFKDKANDYKRKSKFGNQW